MLVVMAGRLEEALAGLPAGWVYVVVFLLVFAEDAILVGFLLPGATAAILGGVTASIGHTDLVAMTVIVVVAAIVGDSAGYQVGRHFRVRLLSARLVENRRKRLDEARATLAERGGPAVFLARFVAFLRAMMPFLAGATHMRYQTFLIWNATAGLVWGLSTVSIGYLAGRSYEKVASVFGGATAIAVIVVTIAVWIFYRVRRKA